MKPEIRVLESRPMISRITRPAASPAPYTTSKLQQDAVNLLRFSAKRTMQIAQGLYEGVELGKELGSVGLQVRLFASPEELLQSNPASGRIKPRDPDDSLPGRARASGGAQERHRLLSP